MTSTNPFWKGKRVLVTGAGGFVGRHVLDALRDRGADKVFAVFHRDYDLTKESDVIRLYQEHPSDIVLHLAGLVAGLYTNWVRPAEFYYQNLTMGTFLLHYAWKSGAKKFLAAGAGCGYPEKAPMPLKEENLWVGFPQIESAPYGLAKRMLTIHGEAYHRQHGFESVIVIPGNIYGPYDNFSLGDGHVIAALVRKFVEASDRNAPTVPVWGTGKAARDFVYGRDVADGMLDSAEKLDRFEIINLSSGVETPVLEICEALTKLTGFKGEIEWDRSKPDGQLHRRFDISKADRLLGWKPATSLTKGLEATVKWYRANQEHARK